MGNPYSSNKVKKSKEDAQQKTESKKGAREEISRAEKTPRWNPKEGPSGVAEIPMSRGAILKMPPFCEQLQTHDVLGLQSVNFKSTFCPRDYPPTCPHRQGDPVRCDQISSKSLRG